MRMPIVDVHSVANKKMNSKPDYLDRNLTFE